MATASTEEDNKKHERFLKDHVSDVVYGCLRQYYRTGQYGYLTIIGGEAINAYLPKDDKLDTGDFDLKFVVNPEFADSDENLQRANTLRLRLALALTHCLSSIKPPNPRKGEKGSARYINLYPKLAVVEYPHARFVYVDDNKLFKVDPRTGEEVFLRYSFSKVFKILLYYSYGTPGTKKAQEMKYFELVDLSLFFQRRGRPMYSFFASDIYDTFLKPPFNKKVPIPYIVRDDLRIPTLPFLIFDNFRMALISLDNLSLFGKDPEKVESWKSKLSRYWIKVKKMNEALRRYNNSKDDLNQLNRAMKHAFELYEPLAYVNSICYHTGKIYTTQMQEKADCTPEYAKKLEEFRKAYHNVATITAKLRY